MGSLSLTVAGLAVHYAAGPLRPVLLLPDTDRDAGSWQDVGLRLSQAGHAVGTLDLRAGDPDAAADDIAHLIDVLDLRGPRAPIVVGHGDGGGVALSLAARRGGVSGVACVAGGWVRSGDAEAVGIDPRAWFPLIGVPMLLCVAVPSGFGTAVRGQVAAAVERLPRPPRVSWYAGSGHDLPNTDAARLAEDLLRLADRAEPGPMDPHPVRALPGQTPGYLPLLTS